MISILSTAQKIAIVIIWPLSWWLVVGIIRMVEFGTIWLDVIFNLAAFFVIPYVITRASLPVVAFFEVVFKNRSK